MTQHLPFNCMNFYGFFLHSQEEKKQIIANQAVDKALLKKSSLDIELVPETEQDRRLASLIKYSVTKCEFCHVQYFIASLRLHYFLHLVFFLFFLDHT